MDAAHDELPELIDRLHFHESGRESTVLEIPSRNVHEDFYRLIDLARSVRHFVNQDFFLGEVGRRSGYAEWMHKWRHGYRTNPNGWVREIILNAAEAYVAELQARAGIAA